MYVCTYIIHMYVHIPIDMFNSASYVINTIKRCQASLQK